MKARKKAIDVIDPLHGVVNDAVDATLSGAVRWALQDAVLEVVHSAGYMAVGRVVVDDVLKEEVGHE